MKKSFLTFLMFLATLIGCNTKADDGVGETPKESTQDTFYFRNGIRHTITMLEHDSKELAIEGVSDEFKVENSEGIASVKMTNPTRIKIDSKFAGEYTITITDAEKSAKLTVVVQERENTEDTFYFRNRAKYSVTIEEKQNKQLNIVGVSDTFTTEENSSGGITVVKGINPTKVSINAYKQGEYVVKVKDGDKTAEIVVTVTERDTGWRAGVYTIENIDGDKTEKDSEDYVEFEHLGYNFIQDDILPASARDRIKAEATPDKIRVKALYHYDEAEPIKFTVKNAAGDTRTVVVKRVTKFWNISGNYVYGLHRPEYITQHSFDQLSSPPKMPYEAKVLIGANYFNIYGSANPYDLANNSKITKVDLNNVEYVHDSSFRNSKNLKEVIAPKVKYIYRYAFLGTAITKIELPEVERVYNDAFSGSPIQFLNIGDKLTELHQHSLRGIEGTLREVRIAVTNTSQLTYFHNGTNAFIQPSGAKLLVPSGALTSWLSRFPWLDTIFKGGVQGY